MRKSTEKGSVLIGVLILVIVVVMVMGAVASFITHGIHRTQATSARLQALYLAEAGVEKAIEQLKEDWDNTAGSVGASDEWIDFPSSGDKIGKYKFTIDPQDEGSDRRIIEGHGTAGSETVTVEVEISLLPKAMTEGVFARDKIYLDGSTWIRGPVNTNSTAPESVFLDWSTGIDGNVNVGPYGNPNTVITGNGKVEGQKGSLSKPYYTPLPDFPGFPTDLPHRGDFTAGWDPSPPYYITDDGEYNKLEVLSTLIINVGSGTRRIRVRELSVLDSGKIILEGEGKLEFYVDEEFTITGSSGINVDPDNTSKVGDSSQVLLYYKGTNTMEFAGNVRFAGSVCAETANLSIGGSGKLVGSFATSGTEVSISGGSWQQGVLYAPNAAVTLSGSGSLGGTIVADELTITGGGGKDNPRLTFNPELVNTFPFSFSDFEIESWKQI